MCAWWLYFPGYKREEKGRGKDTSLARMRRRSFLTKSDLLEVDLKLGTGS